MLRDYLKKLIVLASLPGLMLAAICLAIAAPAKATIVRFNTVEGNVDVRLFDTATPLYVANFLNYVNTNSYTNTFIHRMVNGFVAQGGAYTWTQQTLLQQVPQFAPVNNEPGISNLAGTLSMAKVGPEYEGGGPNSATNQWFFNLANNASNLDNQNGGFTVFGRVLGTGMNVINTFANPSIYPNTTLNFGNGTLTVPAKQVGPTSYQPAFINTIQVLNYKAGDYDFNGVVNAADYAIWRKTRNSTTSLAADGNGNGIVDTADYTIWRNTYGQTGGPGAGTGSELDSFGVPEPSSGMLILLGGAMLTLYRKRFSAIPANQTR